MFHIVAIVVPLARVVVSDYTPLRLYIDIDMYTILYTESNKDFSFTCVKVSL